MSDDNENVGNAKKSRATSRRYDACGKTGHNARTCTIKVK